PHRRAISPAASLRRSASAPVPPRSRRTTGGARSSDPRGERSHSYLDSLVRRAAVVMHHLKFFRQPKQALGMADKHVAQGIQATIKFFYQPLLFGFVEIHHHIAAKNDVVALR